MFYLTQFPRRQPFSCRMKYSLELLSPLVHVPEMIYLLNGVHVSSWPQVGYQVLLRNKINLLEE